jgi:hypothetical protein
MAYNNIIMLSSNNIHWPDFVILYNILLLNSVCIDGIFGQICCLENV